MAEHSHIVGGSNVGRLLSCPGSRAAILALPPSADITSEYAEQGTAMHEVSACLMRAKEKYPRRFPDARGARGLVGQHFHDRDLTQDHVDTMIDPALDALSKLEKIYGGHFKIVGVEQRVAFPGLPGVFGTIDLILQSRTHVLHVDWKFGQGVIVPAVYKDDEGETLNSQLMFYAAASLNTLPKLYTNRRKLVIAIIQPRGIETLTHAEVSRKEIEMFVEDVHSAVVTAIGRDPPRVRGEHCRFAPCKITCPLWTGALLDLSAIKPVEHDTVDSSVREGAVVEHDMTVADNEVTPYGEYLARAKTLVDMAAIYGSELEAQMHAYLEQGGLIPGWKLKFKSKQRQWIDPDVVSEELIALGFTSDEIWQRKLATFQAAEAVAKRRKVKIPEHLRAAPPSTETTLAVDSDPAPAVEPHRLMELFSASLKQLQNREIT
jgi:hypothetical protein